MNKLPHSLIDRWVSNDGVAIHYAEVPCETHPTALPLVCVPGITQSGTDYAAPLQGALNRPVVCISLRGREGSDSPPAGYTFEHQLSDVQAVVEHLDWSRFVLLGYSTGVAFAIAEALDVGSRLAGLILSEYPPVYPRFPPAWPDRVLASGEPTLEAHVLEAIQAESRNVQWAARLPDIRCPTLVVRGEGPNALLSPRHVTVYARMLNDCRVRSLPKSGHDLFAPHPQDYIRLIETFCAELKNTGPDIEHV